MIASKSTYLCCYLGAGLVAGVLTWFGLFLAHYFELAVPFAFNNEFLYEHLIWSAGWALLFFLPFLPYHLIFKGLMISLAPSAVTFLIEGLHDPAMILMINAIWGIVTAGLIRSCALES